MKFLALFRDYIANLVHPSARRDALIAARHRAFIGSRILIGLVTLAAFPVYLVAMGAPSPLEAFFFAWMLLPLLHAYYLSRTGHYETAHIFASLSLAVLVTVIAVHSGGIESFAAVWLVAVPLEAALSASRRAVAAAAIFALGATAILLVTGTDGGMSHAQERIGVGALAIASAALYSTAVALRAGVLARTSARLLSAGEARYHLLARHMTDVITRHGRNGAVMFVSPAAESLFGVPAADLLGHGLFDRIHVADRPAYLTVLADAASHGEVHSVEFRVRREAVEAGTPQAARFIWIEMRCRALDPAPGAAAEPAREVVAVMREVTERKIQEQVMREARSEAERANAAKSRFLATMSHELRTPLNAIIGFSEMLMKEHSLNLDDRLRRDYAQLINDSGHHLLSVVNGILDMSKIETGNFEITPEPFAPGPVIAGCCELLTLKARDAGIDLSVEVETLPEIVADKRALKQIVLNLVSNAIKFTDRGGRVAVGARAEGSSLVLQVEDTGVGIGESDLSRIGDPFFQARGSYARPFDGTGLGVSIVKGLVALHGGEIDIRSRLGEGTGITVRLPLDCERTRRGDGAGKVTFLSPPESPAVAGDQQVRKRA